MFTVTEYYGRGDAFFGGNADDRRLFRHDNGAFEFRRNYCGADNHDWQIARFATKDEGLAAGRAASRRGGLISAYPLR